MRERKPFYNLSKHARDVTSGYFVISSRKIGDNISLASGKMF